MKEQQKITPSEEIPPTPLYERGQRKGAEKDAYLVTAENNIPIRWVKLIFWILGCLGMGGMFFQEASNRIERSDYDMLALFGGFVLLMLGGTVYSVLLLMRYYREKKVLKEAVGRDFVKQRQRKLLKVVLAVLVVLLLLGVATRVGMRMWISTLEPVAVDSYEES